MKAAPLQQRRLSDDIIARIETLILEGSFRAGERLPAERALAEEFGVSRPSLREAIQKLVARGLLISRHGGGTFVSESRGSSFRDPMIELLEHNPEAQRELIYTNASIKQIADGLGFEDESYFGRFFRKQTGFRPTEFRKMARSRLAT